MLHSSCQNWTDPTKQRTLRFLSRPYTQRISYSFSSIQSALRELERRTLGEFQKMRAPRTCLECEGDPSDSNPTVPNHLRLYRLACNWRGEEETNRALESRALHVRATRARASAWLLSSTNNNINCLII
jgi:hypothetical protein